MLFTEEEVTNIAKSYGDIVRREQVYTSLADPLDRRSHAATILTKIQNYRKEVPFQIRRSIDSRDPDFRELEEKCNITIETFKAEHPQ